ncbi:MAG: homoserine O-succinyltransferase [Sphaerochaetaceae bacterium]|jgi:homoserine O-succinyltransferase|nr:homoserine O-succinyltransferase [Sphaerochaetaceae bacterium]
MPVKIPDALPARSILEKENIFVMTEKRALSQDIRPLRLLILNLMPLKSKTETSLLRRLSNTPLQIEVDLLHMESHTSANVSSEHLTTFYKNFNAIENSTYDGLIVTGAPVETLDFTEVDYWDELCKVFSWAKKHAFASLFLCWGAQAALHYYYGVEKYPLSSKMFGIFEHTARISDIPLTRGFDDVFKAPHSRHTEVHEEDIERIRGLQIISSSEEAGIYIVAHEDGRQVFVFGHPEYETDTLAQEYWRDSAKGLAIDVPKHYFPHDDPTQNPIASWYAHGQLLYTNWLNYYVYQTTPYDLSLLPAAEVAEETPAKPKHKIY